MIEINDARIKQLKEMVALGKQPFYVAEAKGQLAAKGPFVGHTIIDVESCDHLGKRVYAVKTVELVDTRRRAQAYREYLKSYRTNVDRVLEYVDFLEEVIRREMAR